MAQFSFLPTGESKDLASDIQELFADLARSLPAEHRAYSGECRPPLDVLETDAAVEVTVDLSGVPQQAVRVLFRSGVLIVAGEKAPTTAAPHQSFHLVERDFGRFARVVRSKSFAHFVFPTQENGETNGFWAVQDAAPAEAALARLAHG